MMHTSSVLLGIAAGLVVLAPFPADAQLGGFIKKKVGDRIADKVLGEQQGNPAPEFSNQVLAINGERLDQLIRGIDAEVKARESTMAPFREYEAKREAWERKVKEIEICHERASDGFAAPSGSMLSGMSAAADPRMLEFQQRMAALPEKELEALVARMENTSDAMDKATARGDSAGAARIALAGKADVEKTVGMAMPVPSGSTQSEIAKAVSSTEKMQADMAKCGSTIPDPPTVPTGFSDAQELVRDSIRVAAVRASGLDQAQYSTLRERVSAWLSSRTGKETMGYVFAKEETAAMEAQVEALTAREKALLGEDLPEGWRI